eukprot:Protomagalhaensia_sp_Gyna_25__850@NODE_1411_length_1860_cov_726_461834_g1138_i0_p2_GENE_NODE_1411_length_1860_cov_726_461834_g1138_i0NODE_1411_length_1860_cov_726_461834_g1138_i0_p2_ORF_typecomplete_len227_score39_70TraX/PF05857_11/0_02DUF1218/PF06749_12/3_6e02DUF1218/PF06749_12/0_73DUF1179/PF06678_11/0_33DUF1179/PF06678_11/1_8e04DUF4133/PF13571_6/2e02DUF4133/PF13571_6/2e02DUF4133/PF13571_6/3_8CbiM/PF01891_16/19_NODE_1411_length_1860_cov_726_461834_g1138_i051731
MSDDHRLVKRLSMLGAAAMILAGAVVSFIQVWWQGLPMVVLGLVILMLRNEKGWTLGGVSVAGVCLCIYQLYKCVRGLLPGSRSVLRVVSLSVAAVAALTALLLLITVVAKCSEEAKKLQADSGKNGAQKEPSEMNQVQPPPYPHGQPNTPLPPPGYPAVSPYGGPPMTHLQPAQLVTHPGAPPQQILIAGPPPTENAAGTLYPVGHAYVPPPQPPPPDAARQWSR